MLSFYTEHFKGLKNRQSESKSECERVRVRVREREREREIFFMASGIRVNERRRGIITSLIALQWYCCCLAT